MLHKSRLSLLNLQKKLKYLNAFTSVCVMRSQLNFGMIYLNFIKLNNWPIVLEQNKLFATNVLGSIDILIRLSA